MPKSLPIKSKQRNFATINITYNSMNKRLLSRAAFLVLSVGISLSAHAINRQALTTYAASLKGLKGASLKAALMPLLKPKQVLEYGSGQGHTWSGFYKTDRNTETNECYNRYSSKKFYFDPSNPYKAISGMNIEHSFPKSWWGGAKNNAYKDLYHLYPSDKDANSSKSNYPMDEVKNVTSEDEGYDKAGTGVHTGGKAWEPGDRFKGDFARTYMYMAVAYGDLTFSETGLQTMSNEDYPGLKPWASTLYIAWNKTDSVSTLELDRNNAIAAIEGNRNLFIDYPNLAEYVWGDSVNVAFDPYTSITTASDDDRYSNNVSPDEPGGDTEKYYFVAATTVTSGKQYLVVAKDGDTLYAMAPLGSSQKYGYPKADKVKEVSDTIRTTALTDAFTFTQNGSGYTIADASGRYLYHEGTFKTISVSTDASNAATWTLTANADGTFKILTDAVYYIQYSTKFTSYGCYNSEQGIMPMLYERVEKGGTPDAITAITSSKKTADGRIFNLQGQYVGTDASVLPHGIYILNGRKIVVR